MGRKSVLVAVILAAVVAWFGLGLDQHLTFEAIRARQDELQRYYQTEPFTLLGLILAIPCIALHRYFKGSSNDFSGRERVTSSPLTTDRKRVPDVMGLNFLIAIS